MEKEERLSDCSLVVVGFLKGSSVRLQFLGCSVTSGKKSIYLLSIMVS